MKAPRLWREKAHLAYVSKECKHHENGWECQLLDKSLPYRKICVQELLGDSLVLVNRNAIDKALEV